MSLYKYKNIHPKKKTKWKIKKFHMEQFNNSNAFILLSFHYHFHQLSERNSERLQLMHLHFHLPLSSLLHFTFMYFKTYRVWSVIKEREKKEIKRKYIVFQFHFPAIILLYLYYYFFYIIKKETWKRTNCHSLHNSFLF